MVAACASTCLTKTEMSTENDVSLDVSGRDAEESASAPAPTSSPSAPPAASSSDAAPKTQLRVGRLVKAHGLKGAFKVELYTDDPDARFVPGAVFTLQVPANSPWHRKEITLREFRWMNSHPVAFFEGVDDRTTADELVRAILWVEQDPAAPSNEEDAWYDHQLVGLEALRDGEVIGRIVRVDHLPAQDLLIVKTAAGEVMVPFVAAIVPKVDIAAGTVTLTPPPGLFEAVPGAEDEHDEADAETETAAGAGERGTDEGVAENDDTDGA